MATPTATASPFLDEAFYAMVASHFPAMEPLSSNVLPTTTPLSIVASPTAHSAPRGLLRGDGTFPPARSRPAKASNTSTTSTAGRHHQEGAVPSIVASMAGHRTATSIYHPQPTRSGRIPVPPPEEELQAMLAMDNYFEFPSDSESDDDDFMPASELNDDDEEQEDDTPRNESIPGLDASATFGDIDDNSLAVIDSAEYDWLMDNLNAMERTAQDQNPSDCEIGEASSGLLGASSTRPVQATSTRSAASQPFKRLGGAHHPVLDVVLRRSSDSFPQPTATQQDPAHTSVSASSSTTIVELETSSKQSIARSEPRRGQSVTGLDSSSVADTSPKKARASTLRKRRRFEILDEDTPSVSQISSSATVAPSLSKVESKRKRNAEQSRTFRERQRARKEETSARIGELEDENDNLRQELAALKKRLRQLEGTGRPGPKAAKGAEPDEGYSHSGKIIPTETTRRKVSSSIARRAASPDAPEADRQPSPAPAGTLSFEDLGKFVAGFVQAKSQSGDTYTAPARPPPLNRHHQAAQADSAETQHPLLLLSQLLTSQHQL